MNYWIRFILVYLAVTLTDICWSMYFIETDNRNAMKAAFWSAFIILVSSYAITNYVFEKTYVIAAMLGAFTGTYITIKLKNTLERRLRLRTVTRSAEQTKHNVD